MLRIIYITLFLIFFSYEDIRYRRISKAGILLFFAGGAGFAAAVPAAVILEHVFGIMIGILFIVISYASRGQIGMGDGIVIGILGLLLGWKQTLAITFAALILCFCITGLLLLARRITRSCKMPFIPYLLGAYGLLVFL